jgi:hypothetical protein
LTTRDATDENPKWVRLFSSTSLHTVYQGEEKMVKRPDDKTPEPPGGRAAERLRMFQEARRVKTISQAKKKKKSPKAAKKDCL